jgi:hypothetical protein
MRTLTLTLGSQEYTVPVAPVKRAAIWRRSLQAPLTEILGALTIDLGAGITTTMDLVNLANQLLPLLADVTERLMELLLAYSSELEADRARIEETAIDDEVIEAFLIVVKVAFPLGRLTELLGSVSPATSTSSPAPNGVSMTTASTP